MIPSLEDIQELLELCNNGYEKPFRTAQWLANAEIKRRKGSGRKLKYAGDEAERNRQRVKAFRDEQKRQLEISSLSIRFSSPEAIAQRQAERKAEGKRVKKSKRR